MELLGEVGVTGDAVDGILNTLTLKDIDAVAALLGEENEAVQDLRKLFSLADAYGYGDWLVFDASVVRGLAYYTGRAGAHGVLESGGGGEGLQIGVANWGILVRLQMHTHINAQIHTTSPPSTVLTCTHPNKTT